MLNCGVHVCIHRHGPIAARIQSIAIPATNIKIVKKVPQDHVRDDTNEVECQVFIIFFQAQRQHAR